MSDETKARQDDDVPQDDVPENIKSILEILEEVINAEYKALETGRDFVQEINTKHKYFDEIRNWYAQHQAVDAEVDKNAVQAELAQEIKEYLLSYNVSLETAEKIAAIWNETHKTRLETVQYFELDNFDRATCADKDLLSSIPPEELINVRDALITLQSYLVGEEGVELVLSTDSKDLNGYISVNENIFMEIIDFENGAPACTEASIKDKTRSLS